MVVPIGSGRAPGWHEPALLLPDCVRLSLIWRCPAWLYLRHPPFCSRLVRPASVRARHLLESVRAQCRQGVRGDVGGLARDQVGDQFARPACQAPAGRPVASVHEQTRMKRIADHRQTVRRQQFYAFPRQGRGDPGRARDPVVRRLTQQRQRFLRQCLAKRFVDLPGALQNRTARNPQAMIHPADRNPLDRIHNRDVRRAFLMRNRRHQVMQTQRMQRQPQSQAFEQRQTAVTGGDDDRVGVDHVDFA